MKKIIAILLLTVLFTGCASEKEEKATCTCSLTAQGTATATVSPTATATPTLTPTLTPTPTPSIDGMYRAFPYQSGYKGSERIRLTSYTFDSVCWTQNQKNKNDFKSAEEFDKHIASEVKIAYDKIVASLKKTDRIDALYVHIDLYDYIGGYESTGVYMDGIVTSREIIEDFVEAFTTCEVVEDESFSTANSYTGVGNDFTVCIVLDNQMVEVYSTRTHFVPYYAWEDTKDTIESPYTFKKGEQREKLTEIYIKIIDAALKRATELYTSPEHFPYLVE